MRATHIADSSTVEVFKHFLFFFSLKMNKYEIGLLTIVEAI